MTAERNLSISLVSPETSTKTRRSWVSSKKSHVMRSHA